jgi:hypothetical protein
MRVTRLDGCGRPVYGDDAVAVSDGFVSVAFTANTDDGDEINVTNAAGRTCVREAAIVQLTGYGVEIEFCQVDPALFAILTGQEPIVDQNGVAIGFKVNTAVSADDSAFALEVWTGVPGVKCDPNADANAQAAGYLLLPFVQGGVFGDFTVENDAISFTVQGATTKSGSGWGQGPYDVVRNADGSAGPLFDPVGNDDHLYVQFTDVASPDAECGTFPLLDPNAEALTSVTAVPSGLTASFTPLPASDDPWWVDFGDGTWDYSDGGALSHTYTAAGDYDFIGYRGATQYEGTVTVSAAAPAAPAVSSINPTSGAEAGGDSVTIIGTGFQE